MKTITRITNHERRTTKIVLFIIIGLFVSFALEYAYAAIPEVLVHINTPKFIALGGIDSQGRDSMASSLANDLTYEILTPPQHGTLSGNLIGVKTAVLTYVPTKDYQGPDSFTYCVHDGEYTSDTYTVNLKVAPWKLPIGIPDPGFGINETYRMYDNPANRNSNLNYTQNSEGGYYTHYIDSSSSNATDTTNLYGTPSKPRRTIPLDLPAGSVVEVHSTIANEHAIISISGIGTAAMPIFVRGPDMVNRTPINVTIQVGYYENATYIIMENIEALDGIGIIGRQAGTNFTTSYITLRNSESHNNATGNGVGVTTYTENQIHHVVLYNNIAHDNGMWDPLFALGDEDNMGFSVGKISYAWVLDNEMYHNSGDGIQFGYGNNFYVGRNVAHHNKQTGFTCKEGENVVLSQNTAYWHRVSSSNDGAGIQFLYSPHNIWALFNHIYDCNYGINPRSSIESRAVGDVFYLIGNVIHDIHEDPPYNQGAWLAHAIHVSGGGIEGHILGNTIYDVDNGINVGDIATPIEIVNNIISNVTLAARYEIFLFRYIIAAGSLRNNIFYRGGDPIRINYRDTVYDLAAFQAAFPGVANGSFEADPKFIDPDNNNFHLQADSPAIDKGIESTVFQTFYDLYGIDIRKDYDGNTRPFGQWDIGAYEYGSSQPAISYGDVNDNGSIDANDASLTAMAAVELITLTDEQLKKADVNNNKQPDANDASLIAQYAVGLIDKF